VESVWQAKKAEGKSWKVEGEKQSGKQYLHRLPRRDVAEEEAEAEQVVDKPCA
jgi:hypothetical protein